MPPRIGPLARRPLTPARPRVARARAAPGIPLRFLDRKPALRTKFFESNGVYRNLFGCGAKRRSHYTQLAERKANPKRPDMQSPIGGGAHGYPQAGSGKGVYIAAVCRPATLQLRSEGPAFNPQGLSRFAEPNCTAHPHLATRDGAVSEGGDQPQGASSVRVPASRTGLTGNCREPLASVEGRKPGRQDHHAQPGSRFSPLALYAPTSSPGNGARRSSANAPQRVSAAQRRVAMSAPVRKAAVRSSASSHSSCELASVPDRNARAERRDPGRARSSVLSPVSVARHDAPLLGERAATRGRVATEGGDEHGGEKTVIRSIFRFANRIDRRELDALAAIRSPKRVVSRRICTTAGLDEGFASAFVGPPSSRAGHDAPPIDERAMHGILQQGCGPV
jgi:hypothetical protein